MNDTTKAADADTNAAVETGVDDEFEDMELDDVEVIESKVFA